MKHKLTARNTERICRTLLKIFNGGNPVKGFKIRLDLRYAIYLKKIETVRCDIGMEKRFEAVGCFDAAKVGSTAQT